MTQPLFNYYANIVNLSGQTSPIVVFFSLMKKLLSLIVVFAIGALVAWRWQQSESADNSHSGSENGVITQASPNGQSSAANISHPALRPTASKPPVDSAKQAQVKELLAQLQSALAAEASVAKSENISNSLYSLLRLDPAAATGLADQFKDQEREDYMRHLAQAWTAIDPQAALAWATQLTDVEERQATVQKVCLIRAEADPADAISMTENSDVGDQKDVITENLAMQWATKDLSAALTWAQSQPAGDHRDQVIGRIAFIESQSDAAAAARMVVQQIPPGTAQTEAAMSVLHQWGQKDLVAAKAWVDQCPAGDLRSRATKELDGIASYLK